MSVVVCAGLTKSFEDKRVLRGVNLKVEEGQIVGLLGKNGSGKSTLIKCILGLLKTHQGGARVFGEDSWALSAKSKARIGYVPQEVELFPWLRVRQMLDYTSAFYSTWDAAFADLLMDRWRLPHNERISLLSPGQTQLLGAVVAMAYKPDLLILDEPAAGLDPEARRDFLATVLELNRDGGRTVLLSTHITSDLERVADYVAFIQEGRISLQGDLDELKDRMKRLRLTSREPFHAPPEIPGAVRVEIEGRSALVMTMDWNEQQMGELQTRFHCDIVVENLTLEEMFLELHHDRD